MKAQPATSLVRRNDTHRLIHSKYSDDGSSVLARIADSDGHLADIFDLDNATNDRLRAENDLLPGIGVRELLFGVPYYRVVNAAFTHAHPLGSRFNGPDRGAWYAAFEIKTAQAEVAFHKTVQLAEVDRFEDDVTFDDYLADFSGEFHDLRGPNDWTDCLDPDTYVQSQALAERLLDGGSLGIVYPSVRRAGGTCLACFRPALVMNVRKGTTYRFRWSGQPTPTIAAVKPALIPGRLRYRIRRGREAPRLYSRSSCKGRHSCVGIAIQEASRNKAEVVLVTDRFRREPGRNTRRGVSSCFRVCDFDSFRQVRVRQRTPCSFRPRRNGREPSRRPRPAPV